MEDDPVATQPDPVAELARREELQAVARCVGRLRHSERELVIASLRHGHVRRCAAGEGCSPAALFKRAQRLFSRLRFQVRAAC
jgi:hypothetical protein